RYQSARALVLKIYHQHKGRYGYRHIRLACRNEGVLLNGKTVRKLMKELCISSLIRVKKNVHIKENKDEFAIIS
ncbi:transposase, partial [Escherichia coli]|nr:transposase [Escherichia coli]